MDQLLPQPCRRNHGGSLRISWLLRIIEPRRYSPFNGIPSCGERFFSLVARAKYTPSVGPLKALRTRKRTLLKCEDLLLEKTSQLWQLLGSPVPDGLLLKASQREFPPDLAALVVIADPSLEYLVEVVPRHPEVSLTVSSLAGPSLPPKHRLALGFAHPLLRYPLRQLFRHRVEEGLTWHRTAHIQVRALIDDALLRHEVRSTSESLLKVHL